MAHLDKKVNIGVIETNDDDGPPLVLIEGSKRALRSLARTILDHANGHWGCGLQMYPNGPGAKFFEKASTHGVYVHLLPCDHPTEASETGSRRKWKPARNTP